MSKQTSSATAPMDQDAQRIIVLIGTGDGASLCAQVLVALGIRMETTVQRADDMNPDGHFEDARLLDINTRLLAKLTPAPGFAPRQDDPKSIIAEERLALMDYLKDRASAAGGIWGINQPDISLLLPIYRDVFEELGIVPRYVFCAGDPEAIVHSLQLAGAPSKQDAERSFFIRSFLALRDCGATCHVLHIEQLLADPADQIENLWRYVVGDGSDCPLDADARCALIDPARHRQPQDAPPLSNPMTKRIGALLARLVGDTFDRDEVIAELRDIDDIHSAYLPWIEAALPVSPVEVDVPDRATDDPQRAAIAAMIAELSSMRADNLRLQQERDAALTRARSLAGALAEISERLMPASDGDTTPLQGRSMLDRVGVIAAEAGRLEEAARSQRAETAKYRSEVKAMKSSVRYRAGSLVANALVRPGLRTLTLPVDLLRLGRKGRRSKSGGTS